MKVAGIILVVLGVVMLLYQGIAYTTQEEILDVGPVEVTRENTETIPLPPILGGISLAIGIVLIFSARRS